MKDWCMDLLSTAIKSSVRGKDSVHLLASMADESDKQSSLSRVTSIISWLSLRGVYKGLSVKLYRVRTIIKEKEGYSSLSLYPSTHFSSLLAPIMNHMPVCSFGKLT